MVYVSIVATFMDMVVVGIAVVGIAGVGAV